MCYQLDKKKKIKEAKTGFDCLNECLGHLRYNNVIDRIQDCSPKPSKETMEHPSSFFFVRVDCRPLMGISRYFTEIPRLDWL